MKRTGFSRAGQPPMVRIYRREPKSAARARQAEWRRACEQVRLVECCARYAAAERDVGPCEGRLECDHIRPKSQRGPYIVENGGFLCWRHHEMKTNSQLQWRFEWLGQDQINWLAAVGWVAWDHDTGEPEGLGWRHFKPLRPSQLAEALARGRLPRLQR
jgi:hypothetical protein